MPYTIKKEKCKKSDGGSGSHRLRYTDKSGKKHSSCHSSKKNAQGSIAAIEMRRETTEYDGEDMMSEDLVFEGADQLLKTFIKECLLIESNGAEIADAGKQYELKLMRSLQKIGVQVGETAGFTGGADVTVLDARGTAYGIEAKVSKTADMGSAALKYDPRQGVITASDPNSPVGMALSQSGALDTVNQDTEFLETVHSLSSAGLLSRVPAEKLLAFRKKYPQHPTQSGRTIQLGRSDLITQHYAAKGENVEYIQIRGEGLYIFGNDPLRLSKLGAAQFDVNVSLSIKVAQKGSSSPGKMSSLSMSAKIKLAGGLPGTGMDLDDPDSLLKLKKALGYSAKPKR